MCRPENPAGRRAGLWAEALDLAALSSQARFLVRFRLRRARQRLGSSRTGTKWSSAKLTDEGARRSQKMNEG